MRMLLLLAALLPAVILSPAVSAEPALRPNIVVSAPVVRLGDLFSDAGAHADAAVAPAPPPGGKAVYDAAWLAARAREQDLDWQPRSRYDQATVERASQTITAEAIAGELKRALGSRLPQGPVRLDLDNAALRLFAPAGAAPTLAVDNLTYDARSGRLSALVSVPVDGDTIEPVRVTGRVSRMVDLPVLARPVAPGEIIAAGDLDTVELRADRMTETYVTDSAELIGKTPRRTIRPGEPVRPSDVQMPIVIRRGELVTLVLQTPTMLLTATAKALEDGAEGAAIRVSNTRSGRMLDAVVTGPGRAAVTVPAASAVAAR